MKKKIFISVILTVLFSLTIVSLAFFSFINIQEMRDTESALKSYVNFLEDSGFNVETYRNNYKIKNSVVRCTLLNSEGEVIFDSVSDEGDNHINRVEIKEAIEKGEGQSIRYSDTTKDKVIYYARKLENGNILRASVSYEVINYFQTNTFTYSIIIVLIVLIFSIILFERIVRAILQPLKNLEEVTARIANGDLRMRVNQSTSDEFGSLGKTFNNMADQLEAKMKEVVDKQNRLEAILASMESGVIAVDMNNNIMLLNPYALRVFGIKNNIVGKNLTNYIKNYDFNEFLNQEEEDQREIKIFHPVERELKIKKAYIIDRYERIGKVIAVQDITDIKKLENMRSQFVANVSHELKTPLTSIKGFAETLKYVDDNETRERFLDIINQEAERLSRLINDILVLSNIENNVDKNQEEFNCSKVVTNALDVLKPVAEKKNISINLLRNYDAWLYGDKDKFFQLVLNLVENSIKYSENDKKVEIDTFVEKGYYIFKIKDNGIGIPKEDIPRIFERFYRVDKARKSGGTGLGLAIVKHIVKTFDGNIDVESTLGKGTTFIVKLKII